MSEPKDEKTNPEDKKPLPEEKTVVTQHAVNIHGKELKYTVTAGTIILKEDDVEQGTKPKASIFYIAYTLDEVKQTSTRPITFSFNGGPGSSSVWMHLGLLGPKRVELDETGPPAKPPYSLIDNEFSLLDKTDLKSRINFMIIRKTFKVSGILFTSTLPEIIDGHVLNLSLVKVTPLLVLLVFPRTFRKCTVCT